MEERSERLPPAGKTFLEKAAIVVAPGTVILALLYYMGRTRMNAYYSVFGISVGELGLSTEEYLLASPNATFFPLWILLLVGLFAVLLFGLVDRRLVGHEARRRRRRMWRATGALGGLLLLLAFAASYQWPGWYMAPLVGALGALLASFALHLRRGGQPPDHGGRRPPARNRLWSVVGAVLIALLTLSLFSGVAWYVDSEGRAVALRDLRTGPAHRPRVLLYTSTPALGAPDRMLSAGHRPYRYLYDRFTVLTTSDSRYYLVPRRPPVRKLVVVRRDDASMRVEVMAFQAVSTE
ncbi:hypothetical protein LRS74_26245 [Streptomyces sp. LX-29]|uniref:hypothetical protein n=1 Tax=Streptomyces sp. LX-29 TaxID=2900152 RepID=UPI00240D7965|nr:hypothetical protein [Streptomyces sp. LX-29]WFB10153.1 hypothetical protein LRS74_26245 [Streptomyces sp. LX-29]